MPVRSSEERGSEGGPKGVRRGSEGVRGGSKELLKLDGKKSRLAVLANLANKKGARGGRSPPQAGPVGEGRAIVVVNVVGGVQVPYQGGVLHGGSRSNLPQVRGARQRALTQQPAARRVRRHQPLRERPPLAPFLVRFAARARRRLLGPMTGLGLRRDAARPLSLTHPPTFVNSPTHFR
eukprot:1182409-Prorocentrum_minimum.AAC.1